MEMEEEAERKEEGVRFHRPPRTSWDPSLREKEEEGRQEVAEKTVELTERETERRDEQR